MVMLFGLLSCCLNFLHDELPPLHILSHCVNYNIFLSKKQWIDPRGEHGEIQIYIQDTVIRKAKFFKCKTIL